MRRPKFSATTMAVRAAALGAALMAAVPDASYAQRGGKGGGNPMKDPTSYYFAGYDTNRDGRLDKAEWQRRGNFEKLDTNKNGTIERSEFAVLYGAWGKRGPMANPILPAANPTMDPSIATDRIDLNAIGQRAACIVMRFGIMGAFKCEDGDALATEHGLFETGIGPRFPQGAFCHGIDEIFGLDYTAKTGRGMHGGIDLPTDFGTPLMAVAAGTVVGKFTGVRNARGITVVLRHGPEDTGLPFWVFTEYAHLNEMPKQAVGQRVRMGEVLGPTGNSGLAAKNVSGVNTRRPGVHFAVYYTDSRRFAEVPNYTVPENPQWMDSTALYRTSGPYDSKSMKALPDAEKDIPIPVMFLDGTVQPAGTKLIWPYACARG